MRPLMAIILGMTPAVAGCDAPPVPYGTTSYTALPAATQVQYAALPATTQIQIYMRDADIPGPYAVVGTVSAMDLGKYQMLSVQDAFPTLRKKAADIGANAVVIDNYQPVKSGFLSTGYSVYGRAIRIGARTPGKSVVKPGAKPAVTPNSSSK